jgi:hypothetical protein
MSINFVTHVYNRSKLTSDQNNCSNSNTNIAKKFNTRTFHENVTIFWILI